MAMKRPPKEFVKLLKEHGMTGRPIKSGHRAIYKGTKIVYRFANTPKNKDEIFDNNVKDLIRIGVLPVGVVYRGKKYTTQPIPKGIRTY